MTYEKKKLHDTLELIAEKENFNRFMEFIENFLINAGIEQKVLTNILLSSEELIVNVMEYAYPVEKGLLKTDLSYSESKLSITFADNGPFFNLLDMKEPDINQPLENRQIGGLGIFMVRNLMDDVSYVYIDGQNRITITKYLK